MTVIVTVTVTVSETVFCEIGVPKRERYGVPEKSKTFWGEEEQRRERTFRAMHGNERYKVCDDESTGIASIGF